MDIIPYNPFYSTPNQAALFVAIEFIEEMFSVGFAGFKPIHGLRNITVKQFAFDAANRRFVFFIESPDLEAYIGYHKAMCDLEYFEGLPLIGTIFATEDMRRTDQE